MTIKSGMNWESIVLNKFDPVTINLRKTIGSGSVFGDQDLVSDEFRISCKERGKCYLSRKECLEPYNHEPIGTFRVPLTAFRFVDQSNDSRFILISHSIIRYFGNDLFRCALDTCHLECEALETNWLEGLGVHLIEKIGGVSASREELNKFLVVDPLPDGDASFLFHFEPFIGLLDVMRELAANAE